MTKWHSRSICKDGTNRGTNYVCLYFCTSEKEKFTGKKPCQSLYSYKEQIILTIPHCLTLLDKLYTDKMYFVLVSPRRVYIFLKNTEWLKRNTNVHLPDLRQQLLNIAAKSYLSMYTWKKMWYMLLALYTSLAHIRRHNRIYMYQTWLIIIIFINVQLSTSYQLYLYTHQEVNQFAAILYCRPRFNSVHHL